MPASMDLDLDQVKSLILQLNIEEKIELSEYLDKLTLKNRFERFFNSFKEIPLTFNDITSEVETVRKERHKYKTRKSG